jgi:pilus assembly protein Flp/PilA
MRQLLLRLAAEDSGQDLIEYALVAAIVSLSAAAVLRGMTNKIGNSLNYIGTTLTGAL